MTDVGTVRGKLILDDQFTAVLGRASSQLKAAGQQMKAVGAQMSDAGAKLTTSLTLPLALVGGAAVKSFADFDQAMNQSLAIMGDVSEALREEMTTSARQMAKETTFSAKQAGESYFFLASAGLDAEASIAALPKVAKFAQAGMFDMALATDLLTDAQSALGLTIRDDAVANMENMVRISDVLVKANTLANATVEQFSTALTREAGAALKSFNIDVEEGVAVLAAFADQGVKGEIAGTGLSRVLRLLTGGYKENKAAFEKYNVELFNAQGNINNLADIVEDLEDAFRGMSDEQRVAALQALGFQARVQGIILPLLGTSDAIRRYESELRRAGGTTEEVANKQLESFKNQMILLKDRLVDALIELGSGLGPSLLDFGTDVVAPLIEKLARMAEIFSDLPKPLRTLALAVGALAAALGPVLFIAGNLIQSLGALSILMSSTLAPSIVAVTAAAAPWLGIAAVVGGIVLAIQSWVSTQRDLANALSLQIESTQEYGRAINALRVEIGRARDEQRDLNIELVESSARSLPRLRADLEAARAKLEALRKELPTGPMAGFRGAVTGATEAVEQQEGRVAELEAKVKALNKFLNLTADDYIRLKAAAEDATGDEGGGGLVGFGDEVERVRAELERELEMLGALERAHLEGGEALQEVQDHYAALKLVVSDSITEQTAMESGLYDLALAAIEARRRIDELTGASTGFVNVIRDVVIDLSQMEDRFADSSQEVLSHIETMERLTEAAAESGLTFQDLEAVLAEMGLSVGGLQLSSEELATVIEMLRERAGGATEMFTGLSAELRQGFANAIADAIVKAEDLGEAIKALFEGKLRQIITGFVDFFIKEFTRLLKSGSSILEAFGGAFQGLFKQISAGWSKIAGGGVAAAAAIAVGIVAVGQFIANEISKEADHVATLLVRKFGDVGDAIYQAVRESFLILGDLGAAISDNLVQIIEEVGVTAENLQTILVQLSAVLGDVEKGLLTTSKGVDVLRDSIGLVLDQFKAAGGTFEQLQQIGAVFVRAASEVTEGLLSAAEAASILDDNFEQFMELALSFGDEGLALINQVVEAFNAAGVSSEAIAAALKDARDEALDVLSELNAFMIDQSSRVLAGLRQMFSGTGELTRKEIEFAASAAVTALNEMLAAGLPLSRVLEEVGDLFEQIGERGAALGEELGDEFERFGEMMDLLADEGIRELIVRLEGMAAATEALGNMGLLTAEQFDAFGDRTRRTFNELIQQGFSAEEAIALMGPQLQLLHDLQEQYGFELDKSTQKLLAQAEAQGVVTEKGLTTEDILIKGFENMLEALNEIIEALGGIPIEFDKMGDSAESSSQQSEESWNEAADSIVADGERAREAWEWAFHPPGDLPRRNGQPIPSFAAGSGGVMDFGQGTLAVLHGREAVVPEVQFAQMVGGGGGQLRVDQLTIEIRNLLAAQRHSEPRIMARVRDAIRRGT